jgi:group I intron endonuclease
MMFLEYNRDIQMQTNVSALNTYARSNQCKDKLQMANLSIPRTSGIYKITCTANGKIYVGSATNLHKRWMQHKIDLRGQYHANSFLQHTFNKYGENAFMFEVLELVMPWSILDREQYWLDKLKPYDHSIGFNIALKADAPMVGRKASDETRIKQSISRKGRKLSKEQIDKIAKANRGQKRTPETCANISTSLKGRKMSDASRAKMSASRMGLKHKPNTYTPEVRAKMSASAKVKLFTPEHRRNLGVAHVGLKHTSESIKKMILNSPHSHDYIITTPEGEEIFVHGVNQFCKEHGLNRGHMNEVARGERNHHKGFKVRRVK